MTNVHFIQFRFFLFFCFIFLFVFFFQKDILKCRQRFKYTICDKVYYDREGWRGERLVEEREIPPDLLFRSLSLFFQAFFFQTLSSQILFSLFLFSLRVCVCVCVHAQASFVCYLNRYEREPQSNIFLFLFVFSFQSLQIHLKRLDNSRLFSFYSYQKKQKTLTSCISIR